MRCDVAAGKYDTAVVLAYLPEDELRLLAEALPEADVVLGGPTGQPIAPKQVGPTLLASATSKGKFLVRLDAPATKSADRWSGRVVELNETVRRRSASDGQLGAILRRPGRLGFFRPTRPVSRSNCRPTCRRAFPSLEPIRVGKCHADDCDVWQKSKHAAASPPRGTAPADAWRWVSRPRTWVLDPLDRGSRALRRGCGSHQPHRPPPVGMRGKTMLSDRARGCDPVAPSLPRRRGSASAGSSAPRPTSGCTPRRSRGGPPFPSGP